MPTKNKTKLIKDLKEVVDNKLQFIKSKPTEDKVEESIEYVCGILKYTLDAVCDYIVKECHFVDNSTDENKTVNVIHYTSIGTVVSMFQDVIRKKRDTR